MTEKPDYTPPVSISTLSQPTPQQPPTDLYKASVVSDPHQIRLYTNYQKVHYQSPHKKLKTDEQISILSSSLSTQKHPMTPLPVEESGLHPCLQKRPKTDQQIQLSSTTRNIFTLPRSYRNYQKARYQRTEFPTYFKEPTPSIKKFINLEIVHKKRENKGERIEGMTDKLHGNVTRYVQQREPLSIEQIAEVKDGEKLPQNILIEGDPGVGKTTLVWELCKRWGENRLLHQWDVVVLIQLRDKYMREADSLQKLLDPHEQFGSDLFQHFKTTNGRGVMIIYDGYDELSKKQKEHKSVFQRLLIGGILPEATIIVTSRPSATRLLPDEFKTHLHQHIEVVGFSDNDIDDYIQCKFRDNPDMLKDFQLYILSHPFIYKAMYIPLHCALVADLYQISWRKGKKEFAPKTITQLYTCFVLSKLKREKIKLNIQSLTDLPRDVYHDLMKLAELAAKGIEEQQYVFDNLTLNTLGLMQRVNDSESQTSFVTSFSFLHLTLQEYLAAFYWSKCPFDKVSHLFMELGTLPVKKYTWGHFWPEPKILYSDEDSNIHWPVLHFYAGLTGVVGTPLDSALVDKKSISVNHNVLYLLFESQNPEYISTVLKENQYKIRIFSKLQGYITAYCIFHCSSTANWEIDDLNNDLLQSMISSTSRSMGGMISSLKIGNVTDYSKCIQMLYQLEHYTNILSYLSLSNLYCDDDFISCDELSQLYRYFPKLQTFTLSLFNGSKLNCTPFFSSLHLMTCLEILRLTGIVIDDSNHLVSNGLRQTSTLKLLDLRDCDFINLSPEGLSQNMSIVSLNLSNIKMSIEGFKVLKEILSESVYLKWLELSGSFYCFNSPNEQHSNSLIVAREVFEGIQQSKSLRQLSLHDFQLFGLEEISKNSALTSMEVRYLHMDKEGALTLKQVLIENKCLTEMLLDDCIKYIDVAEVVAEGLQCNTEIVKLTLENIKGDGVIGKLIQGLRKNSILTSLMLLWNVGDEEVAIDKEGAIALKQVLIENTILKTMTLDIGIKSMHIHEAEVVAEGLQYNTGVIQLGLCSITEDVVIGTLLQGLRRNSTLTSLELWNDNIDNEGAIALKQLLIENTTLTQLTLDNCIKSMDVAEVIAEGLQYNTGVMQFTLLHLGIIRTLIQGLTYNSSLQSLSLVGNYMNIKDYQALSDLLKLNQTMKYLTIADYIDLETAKYLADSLVNVNDSLEEIRILELTGTMGQNGAKVLADAVIKSTVKLILPDMYQQDLSAYSYPIDKVIYKNEEESKSLTK